MAEPTPVPLHDLDIADRIARAVRTGRPADRTPTIGQLCLAFGEPAPTEQARRRVAAALAMAGVGVEGDVLTAPPETRVRLAAGPGGGRKGTVRAAIGLAALVGIVGGAAVVASLTGNDNGGRVSDLPATAPVTTAAPTTTTTPATTTPTTTAPATTTPTTAAPATTAPTTTVTTPVATVTTPAATATTTVGTVTTPATTTPTTATAPGRPSAAARRRAARRRAAQKRAAARRAAARRTVTVRLNPSVATYACVKDVSGRTLFAGTLSAPRVFKSREIRVNIGLSSTRVTVNGRPVALPTSPAGYRFARGVRQYLPRGAAPSC